MNYVFCYENKVSKVIKECLKSLQLRVGLQSPNSYILRFCFKRTLFQGNDPSPGLIAGSFVCGSHGLATPTACKSKTTRLA